MTWKAWLGCSSVALCMALACGDSDGKKVARDAGGAAGDQAEAGAGGKQLPSDGGVPSAGAGASEGGAGGASAIPNEAGAGGAVPSDAGAGGGPATAVGLAALQGTWSGHVLGSYVCESDLNDIELTIDGSSVSSTWPSVKDLGTGEIVAQTEQSFTLGLYIDNPNFNQNYTAQLFLDPTGTYALFVALHSVSDGPGNSIDLAVLQKTALETHDSVLDDYYGDWSGPTFALDADFAITRQLDATASFTNESNGDVSGQDDDGAFSGVLEETNFVSSVWVAPRMSQVPNNLGGMFVLSDDKQAMAVALLRELDANDGALCDLTNPFADMSVHKFGLWTKTAR